MFFSKTHQSSLTLKGGSTSHLGLLPSGKKRKPLLLVARNHFILWLADHQRSRQQRSCILRYATAWIRIADDYMLLARCLLLAYCLLIAVHKESLLQGVSCKGGVSRPIPVVRVNSEQQE